VQPPRPTIPQRGLKGAIERGKRFLPAAAATAAAAAATTATATEDAAAAAAEDHAGLNHGPTLSPNPPQSQYGSK
jgi:hypothetical protein